MKCPPFGMSIMQQVVNGILVVNTETIPGKVITETMGVVSGSTVRAKNVGKDIFAGLKLSLIHI